MPHSSEFSEIDPTSEPAARPKARGTRRVLLCAITAWWLSTSSALAAVPTHKVRFYMNMGSVEIELYGNESPLHVANFLGYVDNDIYDDSFIHRTRAFNPSQPFGYDLFAQGGSFKVPLDNFIDSNPIVPGPTVANEFNAANGLSNTPGSLAAARGADPDSASSGWFINQSNNANSFDPGPYTVFGQVTSGMDIVNAIPFLPNSVGLQGTSFATTPFFGGDLVIIERAERIPVLAGDYDFNGVVNVTDYGIWKALYGSTTNAAADGNGDGIVNAADYTVWRNSLAGLGSGANAAIAPEPNSLLLILVGIGAAALWCSRRR